MDSAARSFSQTLFAEAKRAYRSAEKTLFGFTGSSLRRNERFEQAEFHRACVLYGLIIADLERGAHCRKELKVGIYRQAARAFAADGQRDMAWHCLDRLLDLRTRKNDEYYLVEGFLHLCAEDYEKALVCYDESLKLFDVDNLTTAYLYGQKAVCLEALGQMEEALGCAREAVRIAPKKPILWEIYMHLATNCNLVQEAERARERMWSLLRRQTGKV